MEIIVFLSIVIAVVAVLTSIVLVRRVKKQIAEMTDVLVDVKNGNGNRRILSATNELTAPLAYEINEIVVSYESRLSTVRQTEETNRQLMTSLSHDVRTPLTTLIGYLDAAHKGLVTGKDRDDYIETAFVFMGHGTSHTAKISYSQMQMTMQTLGYDNVFIGTVEGEPEDTACEAVIEKIKEAGYTKVVLRPLMVVAGDHANNDMAGDDADSWLSQFKAAGCFDSVDTQIAGLGEIADVQQIYIDHTKAAIDSLNG